MWEFITRGLCNQNQSASLILISVNSKMFMFTKCVQVTIPLGDIEPQAEEVSSPLSSAVNSSVKSPGIGSANNDQVSMGNKFLASIYVFPVFADH